MGGKMGGGVGMGEGWEKGGGFWIVKRQRGNGKKMG